MDNRMIMELAKQLGLPEETAEAKAKEYIGKSDEEILREIKRIKTILKKDKKAYRKQMQTIRALAGTMSGPQKARLEKIIALLES